MTCAASIGASLLAHAGCGLRHQGAGLRGQPGRPMECGVLALGQEGSHQRPAGFFKREAFAVAERAARDMGGWQSG